VVVWDN